MFWAGSWMLLDDVLPGGSDLWKELLESLAGAVWMWLSDVLFVSAWMDSAASSYSAVRPAVALLGPSGRGPLGRFKRLGRFVAPVVFWGGVYEVQQCLLPNSPACNCAALLLGGLVLVGVVFLEDARRRGEAPAPWLPERQAPALLTALAVASNVSQVALWRSVEQISLDLVPSSLGVAQGAALILAGAALVWLLNLLPGMLRSIGGVSRRELRAKAAALDWFMISLDLVAVALVWTGIECYIWDSEYVPRSIPRNVLYVLGGWALLSLMGRLDMLTSRSAPIAMFDDIHVDPRELVGGRAP